MNSSDDDPAYVLSSNASSDPLDSESQYSLFYTSYNLYKLDKSFPTASNVTSLASYFTNADHVVKFLITGVALTIISVLGIIGNIISIVVLMNSRMRSSISCFLIGLAICDIIILFTSIVLFGLPTIFSFEPLNPGVTSVYLIIGYAAPILFALDVTALTGSVYFTVSISVERYLIVVHPFWARRVCTWKRASQASTVVFVLATIYNIPRWFEYECELLYDDEGSSIGCNVRTTSFRRDPIYNYYYVFLVYGIVHYLIPISFLVIFNVLIYLKIREANSSRRTLSTSEVKENSLTRMLFAVVFVFLIGNFCFAFGTFYKLFNWDTPLIPSPIGLSISTFFLILNSSVNFLIYCTYGEKFREVFFDLASAPWRKLTATRMRSGSDFSSGSSAKAIKTQSVKTICQYV